MKNGIIMLTNDPLLNALLDMLASKTDHPQHINTNRVASDLALVRWATHQEVQVGVTPADRREVAEAIQRLNEIVFDSPDAPTSETHLGGELMLESSMASLTKLAGRWLEGGRDATVE